MEISQVCIKNTPLETKKKLSDDLCRLLQVREKNEEMIKDWLLYISSINFKITAGEIYLAFRMAIDGEILTQKGFAFELYPELSIITTGKVLQAFISQKKISNDSYQKSKESLKLLVQKTEITESEKKQIRLEFLNIVFNELKNNGTSDKTHLLFSELEEQGLINISIEEKKETYQRELEKYIPIHKEEIRTKRTLNVKGLIKDFEQIVNNKESIATVQNTCRCIYANNYLLQHIQSFESFKKIFTHENT